MAVISDAQIASAARQAGIPADQIAIAVAIALAESGGDQMAHNSRPPDDSYGLWQINMLGSMGPQRRKALGLNRNDELFNVATNARAMAMISNKGKNWRPWTTYTRGTYLKYLNRGKAVANGGSGGGIATVPTASGMQGISDLADRIADPAVYRKAGLFILGSFLILLGFVLLFRLQNVAKVIPAGKVLNTVRAVK